jgi:zeaxanthin glucosyltransferase
VANIVIAPLYWHADLNATFALARKLQGKGHHVHYVCIPETEERIRSQGFDFTPVFSSVFPPGTLATQYANEAAGKYLGVAGINARVRGMCEHCRDGEVARATARLKPDLFLVSNHMPWEAIDAWKTGVPVIMFSHLVVSLPDSRVPPISSHTIPSSSLISRLKVLWEWQKVKLRRKLVGKASGLSKVSDYIADLALAAGYPVNGIHFDALPWPRLSLPELVFFPECFDFRRATPISGAFYIEPSIDTERKDKAFPWERLDARPLVFCSLGSLVTFKYLALTKRLFQHLLDAMKQRPDLQAVVAIGNYLALEEFDCPKNVILVDEAPQIALLKRAKVMVGHAGSGCIRESIFFGVPMLLLPITFDGPGNTARAVYHGLALQADFRTVTAEDFKTGLEELLDVPSYSEAAKRMSREFVELENQAPSIPIIEKALAGKVKFFCQSAQETVQTDSR